METVIDVLKAMGKATAREIAARMKIEPVESLAMLREQEEMGVVTFINGYWDIASDVAATPKVTAVPVVAPKKTTPARKTEKVVRGGEPVPVTPEMVIRLLSENGEMNTADLSVVLNRNPRGLGTTLRHFSDRGLIAKHGTGKGVTWSCVPQKQETSRVSEPVVTAKLEQKKIADDLVEPTSNGTCPDDLLIPNVRFISNEICRTKAKLEHLYKMRDAARQFSKHTNSMKQITTGASK